MSVEARIAALMAKAESTDNDHEREALNAKVEELMVKHGIDAAMAQAALDGRDVKRESIVTEYWEPVNQANAYAEIVLALDIATATRWAKVLREHWVRSDKTWRRVKHDRIMVVGFESDVRLLQSLHRSLFEQALAARKRWAKTQYGTTPKDREQFILSFAHVVNQRLREIHRQQRDETSGSDLVLADRYSQLDAAVGPTRQGRARQGSWNGASAGRAAGAAASLSRGSVNA